jgi:hypothetical protein
MIDADMMSVEARRVYCAFMQRHLKATKGVISDYGSKCLPHYDGTSTERPKYGRAIVHKSGKDYKPVWPKIVKSAQSNDLSILELIRAQFDTAMGGPPSANSCHGVRAVKAAKDIKHYAVQEYVNLFNSYKKIIDVNVTTYGKLVNSKEAYVDVVLLSKVPDICKVNILLMMQLGELIPPEIMYDALEEYILRPDIYDEAWGGALYSSFVKDAVKLLNAKRLNLGIKTDKLIL